MARVTSPESSVRAPLESTHRPCGTLRRFWALDTDPDVMAELGRCTTVAENQAAPKVPALTLAPSAMLGDHAKHRANQPRPESGRRQHQHAAELQAAKHGCARHRGGMDRPA